MLTAGRFLILCLDACQNFLVHTVRAITHSQGHLFPYTSLGVANAFLFGNAVAPACTNVMGHN